MPYPSGTSVVRNSMRLWRPRNIHSMWQLSVPLQPMEHRGHVLSCFAIFCAKAHEITFHTDLRSPKLKDLRNCRTLCLHWYDPSSRVQIRLIASATVHHQDSRAEQAWNASRTTSRACYGTSSPPGTTMNHFPPAPAIPDSDDHQWVCSLRRCSLPF